MKVKELIEELKKFDENMEVHQCDHDGGYSTMPIDEVYKSNEDYNNNKQEVIFLY